MKRKDRSPLSKSERLLFLAPLMILAGLGLYTALRPLFPRTLSGHVDTIKSLEFSPDSSKLLVFSSTRVKFSGQQEKNRKMTVWDVNSQFKLWQRLNSYSAPKFTADKKSIATNEWKPFNHIALTDLQTGQTLKRIPGEWDYQAVNADLFMTMQYLRTQRASPQILLRIRDTHSGEIVQSFTKGYVLARGSKYEVSPDGKTIALLDHQKQIRAAKYEYYYLTQIVLRDMQSGERLQVLPKRSWNSTQFVDDDTLLLSDIKKTDNAFPFWFELQLWDWRSGTRIRPLKDRASQWHVSGDKKQLMVYEDLSYIGTKEQTRGQYIEGGSEFSLFSLTDGKLRWKVKSENDVNNIYVDDKINFLLSHEREKTTAIYPKNMWAVLRDGRSGKILTQYGEATACAISPDGNTIATGDEYGNVHLYDTRRFLN